MENRRLVNTFSPNTPMWAVYYEDDLPDKLWMAPVVAIESWEITDNTGIIHSDIIAISYIESGDFFDQCGDSENYLGMTFSKILDIDMWHPQIEHYLDMIKRRNLGSDEDEAGAS